jgi:hypothetical protein
VSPVVGVWEEIRAEPFCFGLCADGRALGFITRCAIADENSFAGTFTYEVTGSTFTMIIDGERSVSKLELVSDDEMTFSHPSGEVMRLGRSTYSLDKMCSTDWENTAPTDRDLDGMADDVDACPDVPEDYDGFEDVDGCPEPDNDFDGIVDSNDMCPNEPEDLDGMEDSDGCPEGNRADRDGDGIGDNTDQCPDDPEDRDGFNDNDGCPDPDNDMDGILDVDDLCPNDPETRNGRQDADGCPDR